MASPSTDGWSAQGIVSVLDTDLYKLTMQCAILKYMPRVDVTYAFTNRTPDMRLNREAFEWLQAQTLRMRDIVLQSKELEFLRSQCSYLNSAYLDYLQAFRFKPSQQTKLTFSPVPGKAGLEEEGYLQIEVSGRWVETILYEVPLLALISEAYFRFCDTDWNHEGQEEKAYNKGKELLEHGCIFSEFGTRRRRDYHTHKLVMKGLTRAAADGTKAGWAGKLAGTSNVHFAMRNGVPPVGTVAHEWFMGIASITNDYVHANETGLRYWVGCFGEGVLGIALTDTFGTPAFLQAFAKTVPEPNTTQEAASPTLPDAALPVYSTNGPVDMDPREESLCSQIDSPTRNPKSYAQTFTGVRQDSGDPLEFIELMRTFYDKQDVKDRKTIVFSDSLNIGLCLKYKAATEAARLAPTFGIGTFFTNDFVHLSDQTKSIPLNIVIKLSSASGRPAIKISDNIGKNTGDEATVHKVKEALGYEEKAWEEGDERTRWGKAEAIK